MHREIKKLISIKRKCDIVRIKNIREKIYLKIRKKKANTLKKKENNEKKASFKQYKLVYFKKFTFS